MQPDWWEVRQAGVGTNRYTYANNDPVNLRDPNGHCYGFCIGAAIVGAWLGSSTPANSPGPNDHIVSQSSGKTLFNMAMGASGGRAAAAMFEAGFGTAAGACARNNTCRAAAGAGAVAMEMDNALSCADGPCAMGSLGRVARIPSRYSGRLVKVNNLDPAADLLADRIGGQSRVRFSGDPSNREFDAINDFVIGQTKTGGVTMSSAFRNQAKATFEAAQETGRSVYYHFDGTPRQQIVDKLREYEQRYDIELTIDTDPF